MTGKEKKAETLHNVRTACFSLPVDLVPQLDMLSLELQPIYHGFTFAQRSISLGISRAPSKPN
jgi:hypothetical protein